MSAEDHRRKGSRGAWRKFNECQSGETRTCTVPLRPREDIDPNSDPSLEQLGITGFDDYADLVTCYLNPVTMNDEAATVLALLAIDERILARVALPILLAALNDETSNRRGAAAFALAFCGEAGVPHLISALRDSDPEVRRNAVEALADLGPKAISAVSALTLALKDADALVRRDAASALKKIEEPQAGNE